MEITDVDGGGTKRYRLGLGSYVRGGSWDHWNRFIFNLVAGEDSG